MTRDDNSNREGDKRGHKGYGWTNVGRPPKDWNRPGHRPRAARGGKWTRETAAEAGMRRGAQRRLAEAGKLGEPGTGFIIVPTFVRPRGTSKVPSSDSKITWHKILAHDTWKFSIPSCVIFQQVLIFYVAYLIWNERHHNSPQKISGQYVCSNHCLFK